MDIRIRRAQPADHPEIGRIAVAAYRHDGQLVTASRYEDSLRDAAARDRDAELLVAERDGVVVGSVALCTHESALAELSQPGQLEFRMLAVDPAAQGSGVGEALVRACLDRAREQRCHAVVICTRQELALAAQRLYRRLGFQRRPELDWEPIPQVTLIGWRLDLEP
jgi:ribosomal protein S18 acetylase RimI-like enzyme